MNIFLRVVAKVLGEKQGVEESQIFVKRFEIVWKQF